MPKSYTQKEIKQLLKEHGCELLSEYINTTSDIKVKCNCGNIFYKKLKIMNKIGLYMCNNCIKKRLIEKQITPYDEIKEKVEKIGYILLTSKDDYTKASDKCRLKCDKGHEYSQIPLDLFKGHKCKICATEEVMNKLRLSFEDVKANVDEYGFIMLSTEYKGINSPIKVKCKKCGHIFYPLLSNLKKGSGCPKCYDRIRSKHMIIPYNERLKYVRSFGFDILTTEEDYIDGSHNVDILCDEGHVYSSKLHDFYMGNRCPRCKKSKGEVKISKVLDDLNIIYMEQYKFDDCRFYNHLPFDFYLPEYNILIEYDGKQHFILNSFGKDMWHFVDIKIRDTVKNVYCENNNIELIRIPYWEFNDIENILKDRINKLHKIS